MKKLIPYGRQSIGSKDISAIVKTTKSDYLTTGPKVIEFEKEIRKYTGSRYAAVCNSGTSALHLAFLSIGIKAGDIVIMPSINFIASFNICKMLKAKIYLSDVDGVTGKMGPKNILDCIKKNKIKRIKAIVTMHLGGRPDNVIELHKLKKKYRCFIIEDSCHALGSEYFYQNKKLKIGCAKHADISTFSFHPIKSITTSEGGAVTTNNTKLFKKIYLLKSHGIIRSRLGHWSYNVKTPGYNFRLSDLSCSLGLSQLRRLDFFIRKRERVAKIYEDNFKKYSHYIKFQKITKSKNSWHLYVVNIKFNSFKQKNNFFKYLKKNNVLAQFHYIPIYNFTIAKNFKKMPGSELYFKTALSLPIFVDLKKTQQLKIVKLVLNFIKKTN